MARTPSNMIPLKSNAPAFSLLEPLTGNQRTLEELKSDTATVIMFICNHCPFVKHVQDELVNLANDYIPKGISFIAISSNDVENYPDDSPEKMKEDAERLQYPFPYLYDETQEVAKSYEAACTPDFYIYDGNLTCIYRGQLDDSRPGNGKPVTGVDIRKALDQILIGESVDSNQIPSIGCNIKWIE
ncbi:thioredoxin family protein [Chengkuizengella sediminis]|uniref:thioredoxin family protein n=1 Tax=Chengkuizengella sediminis TaxID=1885917 RepID=UPI001389AA50|nr:thioredoxin family protein [Chengkuizengella sediminis]NDI35526.1 thioredoxin family protein [Chengkuizengella sediminis]